jgi:hypothetical protein
MLFLLKITVTPLLVAGVSLAARWWGPTASGILMGLPWFTGPTLFILVHERGADFGAAACVGVQLGVVCVAVFTLAYGLAAAVARWPLSLAVAIVAYAAAVWAAQDPALLHALTGGRVAPLLAAAGLGVVSLAIVYLSLPWPRTPPSLQPLPWWDIPMRMAATGALVTVLLLTADALGPQLSGILSTYPVILTVVGTFTHHRWGREALWRVLRGLTVSLIAFVVFFLIVGFGLPAIGLIASYVLAITVALAITTGLFFLNRARAIG